MEKYPAFQFYPKDVLSDGNAMAMPTEAFGIYIKLLCYDWIDDGLIDDPKTWMRLGGYEHTNFQGIEREIEDWEIILNFLKPKFIKHPTKEGYVTNPRLLKEREKLAIRSKKAKESADKRWKNESDAIEENNECESYASDSNAFAMRRQCSSSSSSSSSSNTNKPPLPPKRGNGCADLLFEKFWKAYPKRVSRGQAEKAWRKLSPNEQLVDTILQAIERVKTSEMWRKDGGQFIPYPATWLNAKGWEDEIANVAHNSFDDWLEKSEKKEKANGTG